jgi:hypothetical protein
MSVLDKMGMGPKREVEKLLGGRVRVTVTPPEWSGFTESVSVELNADQYTRYVKWDEDPRLKIQDALPELSADDREILMSGIGPYAWNEMSKEEEE